MNGLMILLFEFGKLYFSLGIVFSWFNLYICSSVWDTYKSRNGLSFPSVEDTILSVVLSIVVWWLLNILFWPIIFIIAGLFDLYFKLTKKKS